MDYVQILLHGLLGKNELGTLFSPRVGLYQSREMRIFCEAQQNSPNFMRETVSICTVSTKFYHKTVQQSTIQVISTKINVKRLTNQFHLSSLHITLAESQSSSTMWQNVVIKVYHPVPRVSRAMDFLPLLLKEHRCIKGIIKVLLRLPIYW